MDRLRYGRMDGRIHGGLAGFMADSWRKGGVKGLSSRAGVREKVRGEYMFSSLMKQKKEAKFASSLHRWRKKIIILYLLRDCA